MDRVDGIGDVLDKSWLWGRARWAQDDYRNVQMALHALLPESKSERSILRSVFILILINISLHTECFVFM